MSPSAFFWATPSSQRNRTCFVGTRLRHHLVDPTTLRLPALRGVCGQIEQRDLLRQRPVQDHSLDVWRQRRQVDHAADVAAVEHAP